MEIVDASYNIISPKIQGGRIIYEILFSLVYRFITYPFFYATRYIFVIMGYSKMVFLAS